MRSFLDLISSENPESNYPYSTPEYREMFRHTLWMVPGVKEASALSRLLKDHPVFGAYKVANVAGDGDAEMPYDNALTLVKQVIKANRYTITISCGKLTTGVTVPEWTAVMMLTGSASTRQRSPFWFPAMVRLALTHPRAIRQSRHPGLRFREK